MHSGARRLSYLPATATGVAATILVYGAIYSAIRLLASSAIGTDDAWANVYAQSLQLGYGLSQPPLYEWLLWLVQRIFGPSEASFLVLKFALLAATGASLFGAARFAIRDPRLAALAVLSCSLFYQIGWNMLEGVTHTAALSCACAATAYAFCRALRSGGLADYGLLGIAMGAGLLAKFGFALFALALIASAASEPMLRQRLRPAGLILALVVALVIASPFLAWVVLGDRPLVSTMTTIMTEGARTSHLARAIEGLGNLLIALIGFSVPFLPIVLLLFWHPLFARAIPVTREDAAQAERAAFGRLFGRTVALTIVIAVAGIVATGSTRLKERHMHPLLLLLPLALFARIERRGFEPPRARLFAAIVLAAAATVFAIRFGAFLYPDKPLCDRACRTMRPYEQMTDGLRQLGVGGVLIGIDAYTAGNLRAGFASERALMASEPNFLDPPTRPPEACWVVWEAADQSAGSLAKAMHEEGVAGPAPPGDDHFVTGLWRRFGRPNGARKTVWGARRIDPVWPLCQS